MKFLLKAYAWYCAREVRALRRQRQEVTHNILNLERALKEQQMLLTQIDYAIRENDRQEVRARIRVSHD